MSVGIDAENARVPVGVDVGRGAVHPVVAVQHVRVQPAHTATTQHLEPVSGRCTGPDILTRIRILESVLLTNGSGSESCSYSQ
jgi:hypothetical protein